MDSDFIAIPSSSEEGECEDHDGQEEDVQEHNGTQQQASEEGHAHAANGGSHAAACTMAGSDVLTEVSEERTDISLGQEPTVGARLPPSCKGDDSQERACRHGVAAAPAEETHQCDDMQLREASLAAGSHPSSPPEVQQAAASSGTGAVADAGGASASSSAGKSRAQPGQAWRAETVEPAGDTAEAAGEAAATAEADVIKASTVGTPVADTPAVLTSAAVDGAALQAARETANAAAGTNPASAAAVVAVAGGTEQRIGSTMLPAEVVQSPVGVKFVEDGSNLLRDQEMVRLLRQPRYFHDDFLEATVTASRCFNCGKPGHRASACTAEARLRPCYLCAQLGHEGKDCPAQLCFRCGRPGHKSRECPVQNDVSWETGRSRCLRCASLTCACANKADYFRYEGGCSEAYSAADLAKCKCYVCGQYGHLCCKLTPTTPALLTCYSCGSAAHHGEECPKENRTHLAAERAGDMRQAQREREAEIERAQELASRSRQAAAFRGGFQPQQQPAAGGVRGYGNFQAPYTQQQQQHPVQYQQHQQYQHAAPSAGYDRNPHKRPRYQEPYSQPAPLPVPHTLVPQPMHLLQPLPMQFQPSLGVYPTQPFVFGQSNPTYMPPPIVHGPPPMAMAFNVQPVPHAYAMPQFAQTPPWPFFHS